MITALARHWMECCRARGLPVPEARAVVQQARDAYRYQLGLHHVVLDAVHEAVEARAAREGEEVEL